MTCMKVVVKIEVSLLKVKARFGCLDGSAALRVHKNLVRYCIFNSDFGSAAGAGTHPLLVCCF